MEFVANHLMIFQEMTVEVPTNDMQFSWLEAVS